MQIITNGRNIELTQALKDQVQQKLSRLENHFDLIQEVHVILEVEKNPRISDNQICEATVHVPGAVIRVEAASENMYTSIDRLVDKLERSLAKHKTKLMNRSGKAKSHQTIRRDAVAGVESEEETTIEEDLDDEEFEALEEDIVYSDSTSH